MALKITVTEPMPSASARTASAVKLRPRLRLRTANFRSCHSHPSSLRMSHPTFKVFVPQILAVRPHLAAVPAVEVPRPLCGCFHRFMVALKLLPYRICSKMAIFCSQVNTSPQDSRRSVGKSLTATSFLLRTNCELRTGNCSSGGEGGIRTPDTR